VIDPSTKAEIHRLYTQEAWPIGSIARELKLHHSTVERILRSPAESRPRPVRGTIFDGHRKFIEASLERWPDIAARRLFDMCVERGFMGSPSHFRDLIRKIRPANAKTPEAFHRLTVHPGQQGQVDWGHFGYVQIGRSRRQLQAFVVVLSWSRMIFVRFFLGAAMPCFLRGHTEALEFFGGTPREMYYDNLKSAVIERRGSAIHFNKTMLALASHYGFEPQAVGIRKGNEKGRVERAIRFIRDSFYPGRHWTDLDDLNTQAREWCLGRAASRPWPLDRNKTVANAFEEERGKLRDLPGDPFPSDDICPVQIHKTPYARYDGNDYTVPPEYVQRTLQVVASEKQVRIMDGMDVVATHERSYDKGERVEQRGHLESLRDSKAKAASYTPNDRLKRSAPQSTAFLEELASRGRNIGSAVAQLLKLLDQFNGRALNSAIQTAMERGTPDPSAVKLILEATERQKGQLPRVEIELPDDPRVREASVRPHSLADYDTFRDSGEQAGDAASDSDSRQVDLDQGDVEQGGPA